MKRLKSDETAYDLELAEDALDRCSGQLTFRNLRVALGWYYSMRPRMQSPPSMDLGRRAQRAPDGSAVILDVDGGKGGDADEVLATLVTIRDALEDLGRQHSRRHQVLVLAHERGLSQRDIARELHASQNWVSAELGKAESHVVGYLRGAGGVLQ
jgi:hypothetical protein